MYYSINDCLYFESVLKVFVLVPLVYIKVNVLSLQKSTLLLKNV